MFKARGLITCSVYVDVETRINKKNALGFMTISSKSASMGFSVGMNGEFHAFRLKKNEIIEMSKLVRQNRQVLVHVGNNVATKPNTHFQQSLYSRNGVKTVSLHPTTVVSLAPFVGYGDLVITPLSVTVAIAEPSMRQSLFLAQHPDTDRVPDNFWKPSDQLIKVATSS